MENAHLSTDPVEPQPFHLLFGLLVHPLLFDLRIGQFAPAPFRGRIFRFEPVVEQVARAVAGMRVWREENAEHPCRGSQADLNEAEAADATRGRCSGGF
jgi:hypothetical protein